jgi:hypothetical protein
MMTRRPRAARLPTAGRPVLVLVFSGWHTPVDPKGEQVGRRNRALCKPLALRVSHLEEPGLLMSHTREEHPMAYATVGPITIVYRGQTQQFATVSQAVHFLRRDDIKTGWFHKITAEVVVADGDIRQTQRLRGQKFAMITALEQLQHDPRRAPETPERLRPQGEAPGKGRTRAQGNTL